MKCLGAISLAILLSACQVFAPTETDTFTYGTDSKRARLVFETDVLYEIPNSLNLYTCRRKFIRNRCLVYYMV